MAAARLLFLLALTLTVINAKVFTRCQLTRELLKMNIPRTFLSNSTPTPQQAKEASVQKKTMTPTCYVCGERGHISPNCPKKQSKAGETPTERRVDICAIKPATDQLLDETGVCLIEQESDRNTAALVTKSARRKYYGLYQIGSEWCKEGRKGGRCDMSCEALVDEDIRDDSACALKVFEQEGFKYWSKWEARCKGHVLPDIEKCPDWQFPPNRSSVSPNRDKRRVRRSKTSAHKQRKWRVKPVKSASSE